MISPLKDASDDTEQVEEDLAGTGLLQEDSSDSEQNPDVTGSRGNDFDSFEDGNDVQNENHDVSQPDIDSNVSQPDIAKGSHVNVTNKDKGFHESIDSADEESNEELTEHSHKTGDEPLDLTKDVNDDGYDSDVQITGISIPDKPNPTIVGCVHRSRSYKCYICRNASNFC